MRRRKTTKFSGDFNLGTGVFTLECPTPPTLSLAPRARPLTTSQSEHHQLIAPQRSQLFVVADTAVVTRSGIRLALRECPIDLRLRVLAGEIAAKLVGAPKRRSPSRPRWVNRVIPTVRRALPVCPRKQTSSEPDTMSQRC